MSEGVVRTSARLDVDITASLDVLADIDRVHALGSGSYAVVYKARHIDWRCHVAYKEFRINPVSLGSDRTKDEKKYLIFLKHRYK